MSKYNISPYTLLYFTSHITFVPDEDFSITREDVNISTKRLKPVVKIAPASSFLNLVFSALSSLNTIIYINESLRIVLLLKHEFLHNIKHILKIGSI